jgi:hypothetical protein
MSTPAETVERKELAREIAAEIFLHFGVDVTDKTALRTLRDDLAFLARVNRGAREIKSAAIKTCVGAVVTGGIALLVLGFKDWVFSFFPSR